MINNLIREQNRQVDRIAVAVEKTTVDVSNNAKTGHDTIFAHANKRYQNQTTNLTRSIHPTPLDRITKQRVSAYIAASQEYAFWVELRFPFLFPALVASEKNYKERLKRTYR